MKMIFERFVEIARKEGVTIPEATLRDLWDANPFPDKELADEEAGVQEAFWFFGPMFNVVFGERPLECA